MEHHYTPAGGSLVDEIAESIADWFGRSVIDPDRELAASIVQRVAQEYDPLVRAARRLAQLELTRTVHTEHSSIWITGHREACTNVADAVENLEDHL